MSTQADIEYINDELSEQAVHDYLAAHPNFFENHAALLGTMLLPHSSGGAVSLVERQISVLRQKDLKLQKQLKDLIDVARANDILAAKIHELTLQLLASSDLASTIAVVEEGMRSGFGAEQSVLVVFGDPDAFGDFQSSRFLRVIEKDAEALSPFKTFIAGATARCGQIRDAQLQFLFHDDAADIGSTALVPLIEGNNLGFLAIGSSDADRFHPGMSIDFLTRLGSLVAGALKRH